jgi:hypothetical protein
MAAVPSSVNRPAPGACHLVSLAPSPSPIWRPPGPRSCHEESLIRLLTPDSHRGHAGCSAPPLVPTLPHRICDFAPSLRSVSALLLSALVACGPGQSEGGTLAGGARPQVFVEALFLDVPVEQADALATQGFNELAAGREGAPLVASWNLLVNEGDLGEIALPPATGPKGEREGVRGALEGLQLRVRPRLVGPDGVRLELDVDLHVGEQTRPLRASFDGRLGQAFSLDTGVEAGGRKLAAFVKAEAVRDPSALARLRERDIRTRDAFRRASPDAPPR